MKMMPRGVIACCVVLLLILVTGGAWFYSTQEQQLRHNIEAELQSIAELKVNQIVQWRNERMGDAQVAMENHFLVAALTRWLAAPDPATTGQIASWFRSLQASYHYVDVLLTDRQGEVALSLSGKTGKMGAIGVDILAAAIRERKPLFSDLHHFSAGSDDEKTPHLDLVIPLFSQDNGQAVAVGGLVLRCNANEFLFPLLQRWPGKSRSAETLLVTRDGENALFLNDVRHQQNTALQLRISLTRTDVPAVAAVLGKKGIMIGHDYRGVEVMAALSSVPDSLWCMVTKIDTSEALAEWKIRSFLIVGLFLGIGTAMLAGLGMAWFRSARNQYQAAYQAEERYRVTLMSVGDGVIACDRQGRVTLLNPVAEKLTGWSQEAACGRPIEEVFAIVNEETRLPVENPVTRVFHEGAVVDLAKFTILLGKEGSEYPVADSGAPIFDAQGVLLGAVLVFRDQTEERKSEKVLLQTHRQLERAERMAGMGCWEFDFQSRTVWASPSACEIYGINDAVWTIDAVQDIPLPEYRPTLNQALKALVQHGEPYDVEFQIRRPTDGALIDIRSQAEYNPEQKKVFGVIRDVTARKSRETALLESESRYRSLFQQNSAVMWLIDPESGGIVDANPAAVRYYGWPREELLRKRIDEINISPLEDVKSALESARAAQQNYFEFKHRVADGSVRDVQVFSGAIKVDGQDRLYSIINDITERKQAEARQEQLQAQLLQAHRLESVGRLAGGVAHDLNNLLSPILGYGEVLLEMAETEAYRNYVQYIIQAGIRARDLVRQLLAFGRKQTLILETVDLNEVIAGFVKLLQRTVREDIVFEVIASPESPAVRIDTGQIEQVIMNLVVNAQDAMPNGGKIVIETSVVDLDENATLHLEMPPGRYVALTVTDTGEGMKPEVREQIFAPFFTTKEQGKGTGLGLATSYGIIKQHRGNIVVSSEWGQGSTFKIYLPAEASKPVAAAPPAEPVVESADIAGAETVMVVEDNDMVRQLAVDILTRRGYAVLVASGGQECLEKLSEYQGTLDLLITDVIMPDINGKVLARQVEQIRPGMKVLYMSGYTENVIASSGVLDEGENFIHKPFAPKKFAAKVREMLDS